MPDLPTFLFATCQVGFEPAVKRELALQWPEARLAYSRPGFLTFKLPPDVEPSADFAASSIFVRAGGFCLGKVTGRSTDELGQRVWQLVGGQPTHRIHVWSCHASRDPTSEATEARQAVLAACPEPRLLAQGVEDPSPPAESGEFVLDCVILGPSEWWVGFHRSRLGPSQWPGGLMPLELPAGTVSRAWLKMEEGLRWARLPMSKGARVAEIGSAPGGASQALLGRGFEVMGIDPAEIDPIVLASSRFTHVRSRVQQVPVRRFRKIRWLTADMNVTPNYTLDSVQRIVTHPQVNVRGMLLTLKLIDRDPAEQVDAYLERIRSWGFNQLHARQLRFNRQEICVSALKRPFVRR